MTNRNAERLSQPGNALLERMVASTEPMTKSVAAILKGASCANLELMSLAGRRARAYLDIPNTLAQCRGPQDLLAAQSQFWQTLFEDYASCSRRLVQTLGSIEADAKAGDTRMESARERDTLTFPDVFSFGTWGMPEAPPRRRDPEERAA
jgi:hypothetical protein